MSDKNQDIIELIIKGEDEYSDVSAEVRTELATLADQASDSRDAFNKLQRALDLSDTYREQEAEVARLAKAQGEAKVAVDRLTKANKASKGESEEVAIALAKARAEYGSLRTATNKAQKALDKTEESMRKYGVTLDEVEANQTRYRVEAEKLGKEVGELAKAQDKLIAQADEEAAASRKIAQEKREQAKAAEALRIELQKQREEQRALAAEQDKTRRQIKRYSRDALELVSQLKQGNITWEDYKRKLKDAAAASELNRRAAAKVNKALDSQVQKVLNGLRAQKRQEEQALRVAKALEKYREKVDQLGRELREGKRDVAGFEAENEKLTRRLKLTDAATESVRREMGLYGAELKKSEGIEAAKARATDKLARAAGRLAKAYAVLMTAQGAFDVAATGYKAYTETEEAQLKLAKTTNLTATELGSLAERMEYLSGTVTPTTKAELLGIAEAAGRMGVQGSQNLIEFTKSIDALSSATDLMGEDAATAIARIINVTGEAQSNVAGVASSIAAVGNEVAATEKEIAHFAQRLASDTKTVKLTAAEVVALGAGLAEMGLQAEGSGTVIGRTFRKISDAVAEGGHELDKIAEISGTSSQALVEAFGKDKVKVFGDFVTGLDRMQQSGTTLNSALDDLNMKSDENARILGVLSQNWGDMSSIVDVSNEAFVKGTSHFEEMAKQAASLSSGFTRLQNRAKALAASVGEAFSDDLADAVKDIDSETSGFDETLAELAEETFEVMQTIADLADTVVSLSDVLGITAIATNAVTGLFNGIMFILDGVIGVVNLAIGGFSELAIIMNKFFGDTEAVKQWEKTQEEAFDRVSAAMDRSGNRYKRLTGESSSAFQDLEKAYNSNREALSRMDEEQRKAVETIINSTGYIKGNDAVYRDLTRAIQRASEEKRILGEYTKEERQQLDSTIALYRAQGKSLEEATEKAKAYVEAKKEEAAAEEARERANELRQKQAKIMAQVSTATTAAADATAGLTEKEIAQQLASLKYRQEIENKSKAVADAEKGSSEYQIALLELHQTIMAGTGSINSYKSAIEAMSRSELKAEVKTLESNLKDLERQWKRNSLSVKEYTDEKSRLQEAIRTAKDAMGDESRSFDEVSRKADGAKKSIRDLGAEYRNAGKNSASLVHSQGEIKIALQESGIAMDGLQAKLGELDRRFKLGLETEASYAEKKQTIKAEMEKLQETVEGLTDSLDSLNNAENENQQSTETSTRKYTLYKQQLNHTGSSLDELSERSVVLRRHMQRAAHAIDPLWRRVFSVTAELARQELAVIEDEKAFRRYEEALGDSTLSMAELEQMSRWANSSTRALDQSRLDSLISSIEQAKQEMIDLRDEAEDTARSVEERLARALGDYDKAIKLQFQEELEELERKMEEAQDRGDSQAAGDYRDAIRNTQTLRDIELDKAKERQQQDSISPKETHRIDLRVNDGPSRPIDVADAQSAQNLLDSLESAQETSIFRG